MVSKPAPSRRFMMKKAEIMDSGGDENNGGAYQEFEKYKNADIKQEL